MIVPTLTTARLTLRPYRIEDFPAFAAFVTSDRAKYMGGPHDQQVAWKWFSNDIAHWHLFGYGGLMITDRETGEAFGTTSVTHFPDFPEPELGWLLYEGAEGKGYASEGAAALRAYVFENEVETLVSYVDPANGASAAVARRLGAQVDGEADRPDDNPVVYRHLKGAIQ